MKYKCPYCESTEIDDVIETYVEDDRYGEFCVCSNCGETYILWRYFDPNHVEVKK